MIMGVGRPIHHAAPGLVRAQPRLNIVPVFNGATVFEQEHFKANSRTRKIVLDMSKDEIAILKSPHDIDPRRGLGQPLEQRRQPLTALLSLRIVFNVFGFIDNRDRTRIAGFDTLEQRPDLILFC